MIVAAAGKRLALVGASGYAGQVLEALVMQHPCMELVVVGARSPEQLDAGAIEDINRCDALALATPHDASRGWISGLRATCRPDLKILDLSDAHRQTPNVHYGLPELFGSPPAQALLVANPGCYPTATLAVLAPLVRADVIHAEHIAVVGASGATGAGKTPSERLHFCNLSENIHPYSVGSHRHTPEIIRHLGAPISFVTHLLPIQRGILVTAFVRPRVPASALREVLVAAYAEHPWVSVLDLPDHALGVRNVVGSHQILVAVGPVEQSGLVPVFASIDNLMRGAGSQALHNLNLWLGLPAHLGLPGPLRVHSGAPRVFAGQQSSSSLDIT